MHDGIAPASPRIIDPDDVPRPVTAHGASVVVSDWEQSLHSHRKGQLLYSVRGAIRCEIDRGVWMVPPQCAVWIPAGLLHAAMGSGHIECYCLYVDTDASVALPDICCTVAVSPLLRELLLKACGFPQLYPLAGPEERLVATLLDELAAAPVEDLYLPMPIHALLRQLTEKLLVDPTDKTSAAGWAARVGMSERTMSRLLKSEVGMSFGRWRRQLHVVLALQRLVRGDSVQTVALELGYESASGFVTMFRKVTGRPPARYLSEKAIGVGGPTTPAIVLSDVPARF